MTARGNSGQPIYDDTSDRLIHLRLIARTVERFRWTCLSYCLMGSHFHLLVQVPTGNLSEGMRYLQTTYANAFNRRHGRVGHLFGSRFGGRYVQREAHLLEVVRYIALNPVRAGRCARAEQWRWSAHRALAGLESPVRCLSPEAVWAMFGAVDARTGATRYAAFVEDESVGAAGFNAAATPPVEPPPGPSQPREVRLVEALPRRMDPTDGDLFTAHSDHGHTMTAIARHLGCSRSTVSRRIARFQAVHGARSDTA